MLRAVLGCLLMKPARSRVSTTRYRVELSQTERDELTALLRAGKHGARKLKRAILLAADAGASDDDIATSVRVGRLDLYRTKQRFVLGNLKAALNEAPRPGASRKACDCDLWTCGMFT